MADLVMYRKPRLLLATLQASGAAFGIVCAAWFTALVTMTWLPSTTPGTLDAAVESVFVVVGAFIAARVVMAMRAEPLIVGCTVGIVVVSLGAMPPIAGMVTPPLSVRWIVVSLTGWVAAVTSHRDPTRSPTRRRVRGSLAALSAFSLMAGPTQPAAAWIASARLKHPTPVMLRSGGVDLTIDTHQWLANRGVEILHADHRDAIVAFLDSPDPTAMTVPANPALHQSYRWRLLMGSSDADGSLFAQIPDHFFNWWTHGGRQWIGGSSAASNAELTYAHALTAWRAGDRGTAMHWLGASVHLLTDACVPQHQFFAVNVYHHQFEAWVRTHQQDLEVTSGAIYRNDFRVRSAHGGPDWTSTHPRGWIDECAHRAARHLVAATHSNPTRNKASDQQWSTAPLIADAQRLTAGYIAMFFDEVKGP